MGSTQEQVQKLQEKSQVSPERARQALEIGDGALLDALIYLEEEGTVRGATASYSTRGGATPGEGDRQAGTVRRSGFERWLIENELEFWRGEKLVAALPALILLILMVVAFWMLVPALLGGLLLGFRYRFSGPDLEREQVGSTADCGEETAQHIRRQVMEELGRNNQNKQGQE